MSKEYLPLSKEARKEYYYALRHKHAYDYASWDKVKESAVLYFLMKTGFNGIYQVNINTNNRYGTPSGLLNQKDKVYDKEVVEWWNKNLQTASILSGEWSDALSYMNDKPNDFIFLDPPYRGSFTSYGQNFTDSDQNKLVDFVTSQKESTVFLCNRDIDDGFFDNRNLIMNKFPVTYTAGRRKKTEDGFEAKPATEILVRNK
jgi:DNA adenine methylase